MSRDVEVLTIEEAAQFLNLKVSNLRRAVFMREISYFKIGALIRFNKADLIEWLENKLVRPSEISRKK